MNEFPVPEGPLLARLREAYVELAEAEALLAARGGPDRPAASGLFAHANGLGPVDGAALESLLAASPAARAAYRRMLAESAAFALPEARAASTGEPATRHGEGCRIRVERSLAEPDQYYVIVELVETPTPAPSELVVCDADDRCRRFALPEMRDGVAQLIAEADSELMRMLADPRTKALLR